MLLNRVKVTRQSTTSNWEWQIGKRQMISSRITQLAHSLWLITNLATGQIKRRLWGWVNRTDTKEDFIIIRNSLKAGGFLESAIHASIRASRAAKTVIQDARCVLLNFWVCKDLIVTNAQTKPWFSLMAPAHALLVFQLATMAKVVAVKTVLSAKHWETELFKNVNHVKMVLCQRATHVFAMEILLMEFAPLVPPVFTLQV